MKEDQIKAAYLRRDADERLRLFEEAFNPLRYQVEGWSIWPIFRISQFSQLAKVRPEPGKTAPRPDRPHHLRAALGDILGLLQLRRAKFLILTQSSNRSEQVGDRYKDIYFDDLLPQLGSYYKIENIVHQTYQGRSRKAVVPSDISLNIFKLLTGALIRFGGPRQIDEIAEKLSADVEMGLGLTLPYKQIRSVLRNFYWSRRLYRPFLRRIRPKALLLTTAYSSYHPIIAAAKETGIEVVEFQHGLVDRSHGGYSWSSTALPYKRQMPIPDKIFLYGDYWKEELAVRGFWREELKVVGSLRIDQYRDLQAKRSAGRNAFQIVFTTQNLDVKRVAGFLGEFMELAKGKIDVHLVIKLHPGEVGKTTYEEHLGADKRVEILLNIEGPSTFELLTASDLHLSICSTCHYEALGLGKPTAVLPFRNYQVVGHLIDRGDAFLTQTPHELLELVERLMAEEARVVTGEAFFTPGALKNMKRELGVSIS